MTAPIESGRKPGPKPSRYPCGMCNGTGEVLVDPHDRRRGQKTCPQCRGNGEVCLPRDAWTAREAAERLSIPYSTLLNLLHTGQLGYVPVGRYFIVPQVEIDRYIAEQTVRGVTAA